MCELLGLNFKLPVSPSFSFRGFRHRSEGNPGKQAGRVRA